MELERLASGGTSAAQARALVDRANRVIRQSLRIQRNALVLASGRVRALGIAGTIRLSKDVELEIVPKLLDGQRGAEWREPLFLLAALSRYGSVVADLRIHSSTAYRDSLYDIAGRILAREYALRRRKPIRQYRRERFRDFAVDGEIDFDAAFDRNPDGIPQERVSFDRINPYNATIQSAMRIVLPHVRDASTRETLSRAVRELGAQPAPAPRRRKVPARNGEWAELYGLAHAIVSGMGSSLESGAILSPGFIVDTWRIWEWLVTAALGIGLGPGMRAVPQAAIPWGEKRVGARRSRVAVLPDVAVYDAAYGDAPVFLVDAKYKVLEDGGEVDRQDLYEAFAFCCASGAKRLLLAYPAAPDADAGAGCVTAVSTYAVGGVEVTAVRIAFGSIARQGDITAFCRSAAAGLLACASAQ